MMIVRPRAPRNAATASPLAYRQGLLSLFADLLADDEQGERAIRTAAAVLESLAPHLAAGVESWLELVVDQIVEVA